MPLKEAWSEVMSQLKRAAADGRHPFRYAVLATVDEEGHPAQRTVVFRGFHNDHELLVHTDSRSAKVQHIRKQSNISLLFYHDRKKLQLRIKGKAVLHDQDELCKREWQERGIKSHRSYTSITTPGSVIEKPEEAYKWDRSDKYFLLICIIPQQAEFLQLDGDKHLRSRRMYREESAIDHWIVP